MSLQEKLEGDLRASMRARDELKLSVIRLARAAIHNQEIDKGKPLQDEEVISVLASQVRQRKERIEEFRKGNRTDMVVREEAELEVLMEYLPEQLSPEEIKGLAQQAIDELGATGPSEKGKVMGLIMPRLKGKADGNVVNQMVSQLLEHES